MAGAALVVAVLALAVAVAAALYARRLATAQEAGERRAGTPDLRVVPLESGDYAHGPRLGAYMLKLVGPADLDSVVLRRPTTATVPDGVGGHSHGTFGDRYDMGAVRMTQSRIFWVSFMSDASGASGTSDLSGPSGVSFDLVVEGRRGRDSWEVVTTLDRPRDPGDRTA